MPDQARPDEPTGHDQRDREPVEDDVELVQELVQALVDEADLDLAVAELLEHVVHLVRESRAMPASCRRLRAASAGHAPRRVAREHQRARVRPRDLEDVELRIQLDGQRPERRDRLVEEHEARRQAQVHRVDQREDLPDHLDRIDLGEAESRSSGRRGRAARAELLLELLGIADAEIGEPLRQRVDVLVRGVDEQPRHLRHVLVGELPGLAEVDEADASRRRGRGCSPGAGRRGRTRAGRPCASRPRRSCRRAAAAPRAMCTRVGSRRAGRPP